MNTPFWFQFSLSELLQMHIPELEKYHKQEEKEQQEKACCSNGCMDCLGLSYRDFL